MICLETRIEGQHADGKFLPKSSIVECWAEDTTPSPTVVLSSSHFFCLQLALLLSATENPNFAIIFTVQVWFLIREE